MVRCNHKEFRSVDGYNFAGELPKFCKTHKLEGMVHTIDVLAAQTPALVKRSSTELESSSEEAKPLKIAKRSLNSIMIRRQALRLMKNLVNKNFLLMTGLNTWRLMGFMC